MESSESAGGGVPKAMPITAVILLGLGLIARPLIANNATEEQLARNVLLSAIPFILIFASIIVTFMSLIWFVMSKLNDNISEKVYRPIEYLLIAGIVLGVLFMFQPWVFQLFPIGFFLLLGSTLGYILWSHVRPEESEEQEEFSDMSINKAGGASAD